MPTLGETTGPGAPADALRGETPEAIHTGPIPAPGDSRRESMLAAAAELIAERGFAQTRIADVAERVGASPALVVYYFGTKATLLTEALRYSESTFYASAEELLQTRGMLAERMSTLVHLTFQAQSAEEFSRDWGLWLDLWAQAFRNPQVAVDRERLDGQWRGLIERIVRAGVEAGEVADVDVEEFAVTWASLLDGLSVQVALEDPHVDAERAARIALGFAHRELGLADC